MDSRTHFVPVNSQTFRSLANRLTQFLPAESFDHQRHSCHGGCLRSTADVVAETRPPEGALPV